MLFEPPAVAAPEPEPEQVAVRSEEEINLEVFGFQPPQRLRRRFKLHYKGADPVQCLDLIDDMYAHYRQMEGHYMPQNYFARQSEITPRMRTILVDWLVEVHYKYKLHTATLWLCINMLDRYLAIVDVARSRLQLVVSRLPSQFFASSFCFSRLFQLIIVVLLIIIVVTSYNIT